MSNFKLRTRNINLLCYDEHITTVMHYLREYTQRGVIRAYYVIKHQAEEETKQDHWHCTIEFFDAKTISSVAKNIGIDERFLENCSNLRSSVCYLIHKYEIDKKHYNTSQVETNDKERFYMFINAENDNQATSDKLMLNKFYELCDCGSMSLADILKLLSLDKNIQASTVRKYTYMMTVYYNSRNNERV